MSVHDSESSRVKHHPEAYTASATTPARTRPPFRPDIEGLRGIAVLLVVLYHAAVPGFTGGYVGVDVFFVLSGYLITWLLVREVEKTGTVNLRSFYARRARRLLPAMAVLLLAVAAFALLFYSPMEQELISATAFTTATYLSNVFFAFNATDYLAGAAEVNPLLHTWSLSVEEQFYVFWPLLVLGALTLFGRDAPSRRRLVFAMVGVTVGSFALTLVLQVTRLNHWAFFSSPTRAWEFAIGGLGVLLPLYGSARLRSVLGWLGLAGVVAAGLVYTSRTPFPGWAALLPGVGTVLALRACANPDGSAQTSTWLARALGIAPLQQLGRLSYSWYLWHWPVLVFAAGLEFADIHELSPLYRAGLVLLSLVLAEMSYRLVENPVRHQKWLAALPRRGLALGLALTLMGAGLSFYWKESAQIAMQSPAQQLYSASAKDRIPGCITTLEGVELDECVYGDTTSATTIVLFGDSHAHHWLSSLSGTAEKEGWHLITLMKSGCPIVFEPRYYESMGRMFTECDEWRDKALARIDAIKPTLIVSSYSTGQPYTEEQWRGGLNRTFGHFSARNHSVLHLRDTPRPFFNAPSCLSRSRGGACTYELAKGQPAHVFEWEKEAAAPYGNIAVLDLTESICATDPCPVERDGFVLFRDGHHMTATFAASLAPVLAPHLKAAVERSARRREQMIAVRAE